ncbi:hypothetical protein E2320_021006 [Naja naja]|nr:hypothetical protein E2320_021006 [Naja naja]
MRSNRGRSRKTSSDDHVFLPFEGGRNTPLHVAIPSHPPHPGNWMQKTFLQLDTFSHRSLSSWILPFEMIPNNSIESLNLDRNKLKHIQNLIHLEKLELNQNQIRDIPEGIFSSLSKLKHLRLNNNCLASLPKDLSSCRDCLQYLNLSTNVFQAIPKVVLELKNLQEFYVQNNFLRQLPKEMFTELSLKMFKVNGNSLREPPDEVCAGGIKQIISYFNQLQNGQAEEDKRVKTMFLGTSFAGKSTVCKSLKQGQVVQLSKEERTVGIEISEFHIQGFTFLFWDFAGQLEYYVTHHMFITSQALVILCRILWSFLWELMWTHVQKEEVEEKKKDIMGKIQAMLKERQTILTHLITNLEDNEESEFYEDQWTRVKEMENCTLTILDLVPVNCMDYLDIKKLEEIILEHVKNEELFPNVTQVLPPIYKQVEAAIVDMMQNNEEMTKHGKFPLSFLYCVYHLDKQLLQDILRYLHRIGLIVWYEKINQLKDTVFLHPTILITLFKLENIAVDILIGEHATIRDRTNWVLMFKSKAILCQKAIRALLKQELSLDNMVDIFEEMVGSRFQKGKLFSLLEHFEICLEIRNVEGLNPRARTFVPGKPWEILPNPEKDTHYLFPNYLNQSQEVSAMWGEDHKEDLHIRLYFSPEIPEGFFQRLMVKACSFFSTHWVAKAICLLIRSGTPLLIKANNQKGYSYIELRCRKPGQTAVILLNNDEPRTPFAPLCTRCLISICFKVQTSFLQLGALQISALPPPSHSLWLD